MVRANQEAQRLGTPFVGEATILLGLCGGTDTMAVKVLAALGVDPEGLRLRVEGAATASDAGATGQVRLPEGKAVLESAIAEARGLGHEYVGTGHLLLGVLGQRESPAAGILRDEGVMLDNAR